MSNETLGAILPNRYTRSLGLIGRLRGWFAVNRGCSYLGFLGHGGRGGKDQDRARRNRGLQTSLPKWLDW